MFFSMIIVRGDNIIKPMTKLGLMTILFSVFMIFITPDFALKTQGTFIFITGTIIMTLSFYLSKEKPK